MKSPLIINPAILNELTDTNKEVIATILKRFIETSKRCIPIVRSGDETLCTKALHELEGAALSIGAVQIAKLCSELENTEQLEVALDAFLQDAWVKASLKK
jgi:HPt (histidine-containing phosphotransfer) domain-containing protein